MSKFSRLFIKEDNAPEQPSHQSQVPVADMKAVQQNIPTTAFTSAGNMPADVAASVMRPSGTEHQDAGAPNEEMISKLWDAIKRRNFPGPDYLELKGHALSLSKRMPSYDQRLLAAFDILLGQFPDFTVDKVIKSIDAYKGIIEEERKAGEKENEEKLGIRVANAERAYDDMEKKITDLQKEIQEKQQILGQYFDERSKLQQDLETAKIDKEVQTKAFAASVAAVLNVLESDKQTIARLTV